MRAYVPSMTCRSCGRLLLWACALLAQQCPTTAASSSEDTLLSHAADASDSGPKLLYVWEYDCIIDWEPVQVEDTPTASMMFWLLGLRDRLTVTRQRPLGQALMVGQGHCWLALHSVCVLVCRTCWCNRCCCMLALPASRHNGSCLYLPYHPCHTIIANEGVNSTLSGFCSKA